MSCRWGPESSRGWARLHMQVPRRKGGKSTFLKPDPYITQAKFDELRRKLGRLKAALPKEITEMQHMAELGDFSENAGYAIAKGRVRGLNERILQLEDQLKRAAVIQKQASGVVSLGSRVTLTVGSKEVAYLILGSEETDPSRGVISHKSPLGAALMGKKVGDKIKSPGSPQGAESTVLRVE